MTLWCSAIFFLGIVCLGIGHDFSTFHPQSCRFPIRMPQKVCAQTSNSTSPGGECLGRGAIDRDRRTPSVVRDLQGAFIATPPLYAVFAVTDNSSHYSTVFVCRIRRFRACCRAGVGPVSPSAFTPRGDPIFTDEEMSYDGDGYSIVVVMSHEDRRLRFHFDGVHHDGSTNQHVFESVRLI